MRNKQIPMTMSIEIGNESGGRQKIMAARGGAPAKKKPKPNPRTIRRVVRGSMRVGRPMKASFAVGLHIHNFQLEFTITTQILNSKDIRSSIFFNTYGLGISRPNSSIPAPKMLY